MRTGWERMRGFYKVFVLVGAVGCGLWTVGWGLGTVDCGRCGRVGIGATSETAPVVYALFTSRRSEQH